MTTFSEQIGKQHGLEENTRIRPEDTASGVQESLLSAMVAHAVADIAGVSAQAATQDGHVYILITSTESELRPMRFSCALPVTILSRFLQDVGDGLSKAEQHGDDSCDSSESTPKDQDEHLAWHGYYEDGLNES